MSFFTIANVQPRTGTAMPRPAHGLRGALAWLKRVVAARRELEALARLSEHDLKDIGLTRSDVGDVTALPADVSPTHFLAQRVEERRRFSR